MGWIMGQQMQYQEINRMCFSFVSAGVSQENPSESGHYTAVGTGCSVDLGHLEEMVSSLVDASIAPTTIICQGRGST